MSVHSRLEALFRNVFHDEDLQLTDEMSSKDISGWDSVAHVNLMFTIEQEFGVQFVGNELAEMQSIGELKGFLERRTDRAQVEQ